MIVSMLVNDILCVFAIVCVSTGYAFVEAMAEQHSAQLLIDACITGSNAPDESVEQVSE